MQKIFIAIILSVFVSQFSEIEEYKPVVVLELFTSQGCSSCPSADDLLSTINSKYPNNEVIALSYHVDYWNYIGWKDPFSKKAYTNKQRAYSSKFNSSSIYTPQVVVNGKEHFVGSKKATMSNKISDYLKINSQNNVHITALSTIDDKVAFGYKVDGQITNKKLRVALVIKERITEVKRGENRNRTLKNANIVVQETYINLDDYEGLAKLSIPNIVNETDDLSLVVLVESDDLSITSGSQIDL